MKRPQVGRRLRSRAVRLSVTAVAVAGLGAAGVAVAEPADSPRPMADPPLITMQGVAGHGKTFTGEKVMQGGVTDGTYWYAIGRTVNADGQNVATIIKSELWSGEVTASRTYQPRGENTNLLGHGNDIAYDSKNDRLIVPAWDNDSSTMEPDQARTARIVDPDTLEVTGNQLLPGNASAICYDPAEDRYIGGSGVGTLWIADADFNRIGGGDSGVDGIGQGIDCDGDYVYVLRTPKDGQKGSLIHVLDWNLDEVTVYGYQTDTTKPDEVEHLTHRSGTFYLGFNDATGALCRLGKFQYAVSYYPGGGTGTMARTTVLYNIETKLRKNTFTREGYTFAGWTAYRTSDQTVRYQNPNDTSQTAWAPEGEQPAGWKPFVYKDSATVLHTTQRGGVHLTAQWTKI